MICKHKHSYYNFYKLIIEHICFYIVSASLILHNGALPKNAALHVNPLMVFLVQQKVMYHSLHYPYNMLISQADSLCKDYKISAATFFHNTANNKIQNNNNVMFVGSVSYSLCHTKQRKLAYQSNICLYFSLYRTLV